MAALPTTTINFVDSNGYPASRTYKWRAGPVAADVIQFVADLAALSKLGVTGATLTTPIAVATTSPVAGASRAIEGVIKARKSLLRDSRGGEYGFKIFDPIDALVQPGGTLDLTSALIHTFVEYFDDGDGLAGLVGDLFISDGEEIVEQTAGGDNLLAGFILRD